MRQLYFRIATIKDYDDFYKIKCDPENVKWSGFSTAPDYERMRIWFRQQLDSERRTIYLCYWDGEICGLFYLDKVSNPEGLLDCIKDESSQEQMFSAKEIAYGVLSEYSGRGIGTSIVGIATQICESDLLLAWVSENNRASERCFEKNSFIKMPNKEVRELDAFNEPHCFYCWMKRIK